VVIEASEPVAYTVTRPDPLTVLVDLRDVSIAGAPTRLSRRDAVAAITLEQASGADGKSMARVHLMLAHPTEPVVRSVRNTIRVELWKSAAPAGAPASRGAVATIGADAPPVDAAAARTIAAATVLDRVQTARSSAETRVTLKGNGRLTPSTVLEAPEPP